VFLTTILVVCVALIKVQDGKADEADINFGDFEDY